jgi:hypothetical protein
MSALISGRLAARKNRDARRWRLLGLVLGPGALIVHTFYPARYAGETRACPQCGKPIGVRAVGCHHCFYRLPAVDILITAAPTDAPSLRALLSEVAREYGIAYAEAGRMIEHLPVAGYRHVMPDQIDEYVRRLEAVGTTVSVVPVPARSSA